MAVLVDSDPVKHAPRSARNRRHLLLCVLRSIISDKNSDGYAHKAKFFADRVAHKLLKVVRQKALVVNVEEECRRPSFYLHEISHL